MYEATKYANFLLSRSKIKSSTKPIILVEYLLNKFGYDIDYYPISVSNFSGMLWYKNGYKCILVNSRHPKNKQNFTLAHELGHIIMHNNYLNTLTTNCLYCDINFNTNDKYEMQANVFAAELLMPKNIVLNLINQRVSIKRIAYQLSVSEEALKWRIHNLRSIA